MRSTHSCAGLKTLLLQGAARAAVSVPALAQPWAWHEGGGQHGPEPHSTDLSPPQAQPCVPERPSQCWAEVPALSTAGDQLLPDAGAQALRCPLSAAPSPSALLAPAQAPPPCPLYDSAENEHL